VAAPLESDSFIEALVGSIILERRRAAAQFELGLQRNPQLYQIFHALSIQIVPAAFHEKVATFDQVMERLPGKQILHRKNDMLVNCNRSHLGGVIRVSTLFLDDFPRGPDCRKYRRYEGERGRKGQVRKERLMGEPTNMIEVEIHCGVHRTATGMAEHEQHQRPEIFICKLKRPNRGSVFA
jgi:hypothetical protein